MNAKAMHVVGLSGYAKSGKSTAADYIERTYGIRRQHIATTLRKMLAELLRDNGLDEDRVHRHLEGDLKEAVIPEVGMSGRQLQITIGTEWGRVQVHSDLWVDTWGKIAARNGGNAMNDSVRFPNEEAGIERLGGFTLLIERPDTHPIAFKWGRLGRFLYERLGLMWGVHDSERTDRLDPTYIIQNDGTLEEFYDRIDWVMADQGIGKIAEAA